MGSFLSDLCQQQKTLSGMIRNFSNNVVVYCITSDVVELETKECEDGQEHQASLSYSYLNPKGRVKTNLKRNQKLSYKCRKNISQIRVNRATSWHTESIPGYIIIHHCATLSQTGLIGIHPGGFLTIWIQVEEDSQIILLANLPIRNNFDIRYKITEDFTLVSEYSGEMTEKGICPKGHKLQKQYYNIGRCCDYCYSSTDPKETYSCKKCDFDICEVCHSKIGKWW